MKFMKSRSVINYLFDVLENYLKCSSDRKKCSSRSQTTGVVPTMLGQNHILCVYMHQSFRFSIISMFPDFSFVTCLTLRVTEAWRVFRISKLWLIIRVVTSYSYEVTDFYFMIFTRFIIKEYESAVIVLNVCWLCRHEIWYVDRLHYTYRSCTKCCL